MLVCGGSERNKPFWMQGGCWAKSWVCQDGVLVRGACQDPRPGRVGFGRILPGPPISSTKGSLDLVLPSNSPWRHLHVGEPGDGQVLDIGDHP